jgi:hypothetical protein
MGERDAKQAPVSIARDLSIVSKAADGRFEDGTYSILRFAASAVHLGSPGGEVVPAAAQQVMRIVLKRRSPRREGEWLATCNRAKVSR